MGNLQIKEKVESIEKGTFGGRVRLVSEEGAQAEEVGRGLVGRKGEEADPEQ